MTNWVTTLVYLGAPNVAGGHVLGGGPAHESQRVSLKSKQVLKTYFYFILEVKNIYMHLEFRWLLG